MGLPAYFGFTTCSSTGYMEARTLILVGREFTNVKYMQRGFNLIYSKLITTYKATFIQVKHFFNSHIHVGMQNDHNVINLGKPYILNFEWNFFNSVNIGF